MKNVQSFEEYLNEDFLTKTLESSVVNEAIGIHLTSFDIGVIIKALESDKILDQQARKMLVQKLQDLKSGKASFIDWNP